MKPLRAVAMFSGGLDSCLAVQMIKQQGVEVIAINFQTPFNVARRDEGKPDPVGLAAEQLGVELVRVLLGHEYIEMLKSPIHGYGRALNPCIDCRIFFMKKAAEFMRDRRAGFIITGEVPGQRPMSQRRETIALIDKETGCGEYILRPLSAKLLAPTIPEEKGWVDREKLLDISGRARSRQIELALAYGLKDYPAPAGGCLLTEPEYSRKLEDLFRHVPDISRVDLELLKTGRHFRLSGRVKIVVGRNDADNMRILALAEDDDLIIEGDDIPGPTTLISGQAHEEEIRLAAGITARYLGKRRKGSSGFKVMRGSERATVARIEAMPFGQKEIEAYRI